MAEYIEREKAIAICQGYYEHCLEMHDFSGDSVAYDIRTNIRGLPTADVVPVVRCKDCKYLEIDKGWREGRACLRKDPVDTHFCRDNDYCSYGERKDSDEKSKET